MGKIATYSIAGLSAAAIGSVSKNLGLAALIGIGVPAAGTGFTIAVLKARESAIAQAEQSRLQSQRSDIETHGAAPFEDSARAVLLVGRQLIEKQQRSAIPGLIEKIDRLIGVGKNMDNDQNVVRALETLRLQLAKLNEASAAL
jgi:hypothetical protein